MSETPQQIKEISQAFAQAIMESIKESNISKSVTYTTFVNLIGRMYSLESDDLFEEFIDGLREVRDTIMTEQKLLGDDAQ